MEMTLRTNCLSVSALCVVMDVFLLSGMAGTIYFLSEMADPQASCFPAFELWAASRADRGRWRATQRRPSSWGSATKERFIWRTLCGCEHKVFPMRFRTCRKVLFFLDSNSMFNVGVKWTMVIFPLEMDAASCEAHYRSSNSFSVSPLYTTVSSPTETPANRGRVWVWQALKGIKAVCVSAC